MLFSLMLCLTACVHTPPVVAPMAAPTKPALRIVTLATDTVAIASWTAPNGNGGSPQTGYAFRWFVNGTAGAVKSLGVGTTADTLSLTATVAPGGTVTVEGGVAVVYAAGASVEKKSGPLNYTRPAALLPVTTITVTVRP